MVREACNFTVHAQRVSNRQNESLQKFRGYEENIGTIIIQQLKKHTHIVPNCNRAEWTEP